MTTNVSSARPQALFRYAYVAVGVDHLLSQEVNRLAGVLGHFEDLCTEYRVHVSYLADSIRNYVDESEQSDRWVSEIGAGFLKADLARLRRWVDLLQPIVGAGLVAASIRSGSTYTGQIVIDLPDFLRSLGISLRSVREWAGLSAHLNTIKFTSVPAHMLRVGLIVSVPVIAWKWAQDAKEYKGAELAKAMLVDAGLTLAPVAVSSGVSWGITVIGAAAVASGVVAAAPVAAVAIVGGVVAGAAFKWAMDSGGAREKAMAWRYDETIRPIVHGIVGGYLGLRDGLGAVVESLSGHRPRSDVPPSRQGERLGSDTGGSRQPIRENAPVNLKAPTGDCVKFVKAQPGRRVPFGFNSDDFYSGKYRGQSGTIPDGTQYGQEPRPGAIMVESPRKGNSIPFGHASYVTEVTRDGDGRVTGFKVAEGNWSARAKEEDPPVHFEEFHWDEGKKHYVSSRGTRIPDMFLY